MTDPATPFVEWKGSTAMDAPLVVLLHGWGESETDMTAFVPSLPQGLAYASLRAPYELGRRYAWFASGRSFTDTVRWFDSWLDGVAPPGRRVVLVGFSAGAAFAGGALLHDPARYAGTAILYGTLPFDARLTTPPHHLVGANVYLAHSAEDPMIPAELLDRAWKYLTEDSGACVHAVRRESGHGMSDEAMADLALWIREVALR